MNGKSEQASRKSIFVFEEALGKDDYQAGHEYTGDIMSEPHTAPWSVSSHTQHYEAALISLVMYLPRLKLWLTVYHFQLLETEGFREAQIMGSKRVLGYAA